MGGNARNRPLPFLLCSYHIFLLPSMASSSSSTFRYNAHGIVCSIFQEPLKGKLCLLKCGHVFYEECLKAWRESNGGVPVISVDEPISNTEKCPECRALLIVHKIYENYVNYKGNMNTEEKSKVEKRAIEEEEEKREEFPSQKAQTRRIWYSR